MNLTEQQIQDLPILRLYRLKMTMKNTLGVLVGDKIMLSTLELPWLNNKQNESCIPLNCFQPHKKIYNPDPYIVVPRTSKKFKKHFHVTGVENRSYILFHTLNYHYQTEGCIGLGTYVKDIDGDGIPDLSYSQKAMNELLKHYPNGFRLYIYEP
jgi:hypothetical protein